MILLRVRRCARCAAKRSRPPGALLRPAPPRADKKPTDAGPSIYPIRAGAKSSRAILHAQAVRKGPGPIAPGPTGQYSGPAPSVPFFYETLELRVEEAVAIGADGFREHHLAEAWFPRMPLIGSPVAENEPSRQLGE